jgi:hypothetical protein
MEGYWEIDYGYLNDHGEFGDQDYHNFGIAFTRRYGVWLSNSVRVIANFGQERDPGFKQTADGFIVLLENSFITSQPSTVVPYVNLFAGFDHPQSLARDAGAGGILLNTGILFETDGLTGFPKLDDTGFNTYGGALGIEFLFGLDQQLVLEGAIVQVDDDKPDRTALGNQYGLGFRYQIPVNNAMILRVDGMYGWREDEEDLSGIRFEFRWKF